MQFALKVAFFVAVIVGLLYLKVHFIHFLYVQIASLFSM